MHPYTYYTRNRLARHTPHLSPDCPRQSQVRSNLYSVSSVGLVIFVVDRIQLNFTGVERKEQCRTTVSYSTIDQDTIQSSDPHQLQTHTPYHAISRTPLISLPTRVVRAEPIHPDAWLMDSIRFNSIQLCDVCVPGTTPRKSVLWGLRLEVRASRAMRTNQNNK